MPVSYTHLDVYKRQCVGRMRYVGVVLYDMDKVQEMAATKDEQEI